MAIKETDIEVGFQYKAGNNQDRIALGFSKDGKVVYTSRGGNALNPFKNQLRICKKETFAKACSIKEFKVKQATLDKLIDDNQARDIIGN